MKPVRAYAGFALVLLVAGYSLFALVREQKSHYEKVVKVQGDAITNYQERFRGVREALPPGGSFGFFTDIADHTENRAAMYLTQYALAPLVLHETTDLPRVVGNFHRGYPDPEFLQRKGLHLLYRSGSGIMLFDGTPR